VKIFRIHALFHRTRIYYEQYESIDIANRIIIVYYPSVPGGQIGFAALTLRTVLETECFRIYAS
jgi:hypothetical protein